MEFVGLFLSKEDKRPLYLQLYHFLVDEMRSGRVKAGEKLPGKRTAATQLGISVNTVDEAYQRLVDEGYVQAKPRSGFITNDLGQ
ncbi:winged helix-turn-helix domain-containing protein, partial [Ruminococcaceae bacterium OttesenSCG-928-I18]|nr:winged helix-turn-helix domain-containing protein [Ruminococcaceae bacterium OttesenSCG-928-I18]